MNGISFVEARTPALSGCVWKLGPLRAAHPEPHKIPKYVHS